MVDCETLYYSPFSSPYPYSVPTTALRAQNADTLYTEWNAASAVRNLGHAVGLRTEFGTEFETDSNGVVLCGCAWE